MTRSALRGLALLALSDAAVVVTVDVSKVLYSLDARFAGATLDIQDFVGFNIAPWTWDWGSGPLRTLVGALAPMVVRVGGTWQDGIFWEGGPRTGQFLPRTKAGMAPRTLTTKDWDAFAGAVGGLPGVDLVVGLSALWRSWGDCDAPSSTSCAGDVAWDGTNAASFVTFNRGANHSIWGYELGNEPGVWNYTWGTPVVTAAQHAKDYAGLRAVVDAEHAADAPEDRPRVLGPDTTWGPVGDELPSGSGRRPAPPVNYFGETLSLDPDVDVATFHYYGIQPYSIASWRTFVNIARTKSFCGGVEAHRAALDASPLGGRGVPLWLGEGGASYGGFSPTNGAQNYLRLFGGALSYLDNLGCAASSGAALFLRQQLSNFVGGATTEKGTAYAPQPPWWVAVLFKKLVGTRSLAANVQHDGGSDHLHAFAFDRRAGVPGAVLALVNWDDAPNSTTAVQVAGCASSADVYALSAGDVQSPGDAVNSAKLAVNGREATVDDDGAVASGSLAPKTVACAAGVLRLDLAGLSGAFVVLPADA